MPANATETRQGRCLCGAVAFEVEGPLGPVVFCHCSICRRSSGSAFAASASVPAASFRIVRGEEAVHEYESSDGYFRAFCSRCGSPVYGRSARSPEVRRVRLGTLEGGAPVRAQAHVWTSSKAPWFDIGDGMESFEGMPPPSYILPPDR